MTSTRAGSLAGSFALLGHVPWVWIAVGLVLESVSTAAFAVMLRRLLAAGRARVGTGAMLATTYAANALSVSVPLAGPGLGTAFTFRRFTRQGADAPLAGWSLLAGGVVSSAAAALIVVGGGLSSGNVLATAVAVPGGVLAVAALVVVGAAARRPRLRGALERPAAWTLRQAARVVRRPVGDPRTTIRAWAGRLGSLRLPASGWVTVAGLALVNWLADAGVLAVSIHAAGAAVPWHLLLLVYGSGVAAQSLNVVPGGLGITEGALGLTLVASGLHASQALAAVCCTAWPVSGWSPRPDGRSSCGCGTAAGPRPRGEHDSSMPELVLLHGQPGSAADWQQVAERLPSRLHAVAADRPGYGSSPLPPGGFAAGARAVLDDLDARGIQRAVLVGHSYGGGVALSAAALAPDRVDAVVLLASVGPGCVNGWDRLLAAPGAGPLCALIAWRLTPWLARARLAAITRWRGRPPGPGEHVNWQVWAQGSREPGSLWRTFLAEQRALLRELDDLTSAVPSVQAPVLLLADPGDTPGAPRTWSPTP